MGYIGWGREERVVVGGSRFPLVRPLSFVEEFPYSRWNCFPNWHLKHIKYLVQKTPFPTLKPRCFRTWAVPSYDEDSSNSDWCGLQLKHVTRPEWPGSCRKESVRGAERGLGPDEWPDCKQQKHISYWNDKWEYVFKLKSLILKIYNIQEKFYVFFFFYQENVAVRTPATVRTVRGKLFNNGKPIVNCVVLS